MLLDATGAFRMTAGRMFTPLLLIVLGATMTFDRGGFVAGRRTGRRGADGEGRSPAAGPQRALGLLADRRRRVDADLAESPLRAEHATSWPLFIILSGLMLVLRGIR